MNDAERTGMSDYTGKNLVFVVGCPRSGTTWLQRLLMCHPQIHSGQESDIFDMFVGPQWRAWKSLVGKKEGRTSGLPAYFKSEDYKKALKSYLMDLLKPMIANLGESEIFLEKTPSHAMYLNEIMELLPDARIIHILRDVRDVVASLVAASQGWGKSWAPSGVEAAAKMWLKHIQAVNQYKKNIPDNNFLEIRYEELNSPCGPKVLRSVFEFLGLEYSDEQIKSAFENNKIDKAVKSGGTEIPVHGEFREKFGQVAKEPEGFFRKGKSGSWKEELSEADLEIIDKIAGDYILKDIAEIPSQSKYDQGQKKKITNRLKFRPLFIQPTYPSSPFSKISLPAGIGYLAEILEQADYEYEICDLQVESEADLFHKITAFEPSHIGLSLMSLDYENHYSLIHRIKQFRSDIPIIVGGPHASYIQDAVLDESPDVDLVVPHEGEPFIRDMMESKHLEEIPGIIFRQDDKKIQTARREWIENLDEIPFPRYTKLNMNHYGSRMLVISSRGCPFSCIFCGAHKSMGRKWRAKSVPKMIEEIRYWYQRGYTRFNFADSNFFMSHDRIKQFCNELKKLNVKIAISSDGMRAKDFDAEMMKVLKEYALEYVAIGIESANDDILKLIKKGETLEDIRYCMDGLQKLGIDVVAFFIIGLPGETLDHVFNSFDFALKYPGIRDVHFFAPKPFEGTELYEICQKNGYLQQNAEDCRKKGDKIPIVTPELSAEIRCELMKLAKQVKEASKLQYQFYKQFQTIAPAKKQESLKEIQNIRIEIEQSKNRIRSMADFQNQPSLKPAFVAGVKETMENIDSERTRQSYHKKNRDINRIISEFKSYGIPFEEKTIDINDFVRWMEDFKELPDRYRKMGDVFIEKSLEHYLALQWLGLKNGDVYIDIAAASSNFADVLQKRGISAYKLDLSYPAGVHGMQIGADAGNTQLPNNSISGMSLQCAFECFQGDADIRFLRESQRILKPGGKVIITPLYMDNIYHNITSEFCDQDKIQFDDGALKVWRDDQYKAPFSRHYSPEAFCRRIIRNINPENQYKIVHYTNLEELKKVFPSQRIYCDLLFYMEKKAAVAVNQMVIGSNVPSLSVIIPTRNRDASLERTLQSLALVHNPKCPYEIIVVDNGSTDTTRQVTESFGRSSLHQLRYISEPNPGLHNGRHRGAFEAQGEILCYLDDDVKVDPMWLYSVKEAFETTGAALVGGKILPEYEQAPPDWLKEFVKPVGDYGYYIGQLTLIDLGEQVREIDPIYVWGANFSIRKSVLFACGGFRPDSMPKELIYLRGDGETGLSRAIQKKGYKAFYHPKAMVRHCISKDRLTVEYFCTRMFNQGISDSFTEVRKSGKAQSPVVAAVYEAYQEGKLFHRRQLRNDSRLFSWVLKKDYFSEIKAETSIPLSTGREKSQEDRFVQV